MAREFGRMIYRERRRLLFVTFLAFMAGAIFYLRADVVILGMPLWFLTGAIYAGIIGPIALIFCVLIPSFRFMIEAIAVSRLIISVIVFLMPGVGVFLLTTPLVMAFSVVTGGILVSRVMHGRIVRKKAAGWRDRIWPKHAFRKRAPLIDALPWQYRYVRWMDDAVPVRV